MTTEDTEATTEPSPPVASSSVEQVEGEGPATDGEKGAGLLDRNERWAAIVFGAYLVVAFFLLVFVYGEGSWFHGDEWALIVDTDLTDPSSLFGPRNTHWSTVPIVVYQVFIRVFGLGTYLPYQVGVALLHLTLATLIRVVMRRAGVGPWVATVAAGTFVLFGPGYENSLKGIQISMVGSMVCGFGHLILADHDGRFDRRDVLGLVLGVVGLMSSGIGPPLIAVVGVAVFVRRGWRMAAAHTVPLVALYGLWWVLLRSQFEEQQKNATFDPDILFGWVSHGETGVFLALGHYRPVAVALAVLLVGGLALAWIPLSFADLRRKAAAPAALLVGGAVLFALVATQRWILGEALARSSRYLAMGAALTLPALAVAADAVIRRWKVTAPVVLLLFVLGVVPGLEAFDQRGFDAPFFQGQKELVLGAAHSPLIDELDPDVQLDPNQYSTAEVDVEFLRDARDRGLIPQLDEPLTPHKEAVITTRLSLAQRQGPADERLRCETFDEPLRVKAQKDDQFRIGSDVKILIIPDDKEAERVKVPYSYIWGDILEVEVPKLRFQVEGLQGGPFAWCS